VTAPPTSDPRWRNLLLGDEARFESLATELVVLRLREVVRSDAGCTQSAIEELHRYFVTNSFAVEDLISL